MGVGSGMSSSSPTRMVSSFNPFTVMIDWIDTLNFAAIELSVSLATTLYLRVAMVGAGVGICVGCAVTGRIVKGGVDDLGVRVGVAVAPVAPNPKPAPPNTMNKTPQMTAISKTRPAIMIHGDTDSAVVSPRCAGTRCTMRSIRHGSERKGRDGGGDDGRS